MACILGPSPGKKPCRNGGDFAPPESSKRPRPVKQTLTGRETLLRPKEQTPPPRKQTLTGTAPCPGTPKCRILATRPFASLENPMPRVAIMNDLPTSQQLRAWVEAARPGIQVDQWFNRRCPKPAVGAETSMWCCSTSNWGANAHAGVAIINAINKRGLGTPVLVVSAMPAAVYRSIMKALDAWDYLQKTTFEEGRLHRHLSPDSAQRPPRQPCPGPAPGYGTEHRPPVAAQPPVARAESESAPHCPAHPETLYQRREKSCPTTSYSKW